MTAIFTSLFRQHCNVYITTSLAVRVMLAALLTGMAHAEGPTPSLSSDTAIATADFYHLSWKTDQAGRVELQQADNPAFTHATLRYRGPDRASVISGMPNGKWYYRVRTLDDQDPGPWSKTVMVSMAHHPLSLALMFFALGVAVFLVTVVLILRGAEESP